MGVTVLNPQELVEQFTDLYWNVEAPWTRTFWRGHQVAKCPLDLWTYQEILFETKPDLLIETGSSIGGSALFFASIFDMIGSGWVLTIDKDFYPNRAQHPRIEYLTGDSLSMPMFEAVEVAALGRIGQKIMVVLDSLHTYDHVAGELGAYAHLVSPGCYLVVEDTGVDKAWGKPAALRATEEYLARNPHFQVDHTREKHLLTFNPGGWIRRAA